MFFGRSMARKSRDSLALCIAAVLSSGVMNTVCAGEGTHFSLQTVPRYAPGFPGAQRTFAPTRNLPRVRQAHAPAATSAMTAVVTSCADDGGFDTLRHAVLAANPTDTIDLSGLSCSKLTLQAGAIDVAVSDLTILGPGRGALTIDGNQTDRVFKHDGAGTLTLSNLTVANGKHAADKAYGGCIYAKGKVVLNGVIVTSCTALGQTSAIGGAIFAKDDLDLESSTLADNRAEAQVGVAGDLGAVAGAAVSLSALTLTNSVISGNIAQAPTGKVVAGGLVAPSLSAKYSTLTGNKAIAAGDVSSAGIAGAVYVDKLLLRGSTIDHNEADVAGAVYVRSVDPSSYATILQSTISSNRGNLAFGGLVTQATLAIANSTIAFNTAGGVGGPAVGIFSGVTATLESTIIADNAPLDLDGGGAIAGANNLVKIAGQNVTLPQGTFTLDPQLGPLQFNGGHTRTHALLPGSPAIDQGDDGVNLPTDQRGQSYHRVVGSKADIGAFEVDADHIFGDALEPTPPLS